MRVPLPWQAALDLTLPQARELLAACERRDAGNALLSMRCQLSAHAATISKTGGNLYTRLEKTLQRAAIQGSELPPLKQRVSALVGRLRALGAGMATS